MSKYLHFYTPKVAGSYGSVHDGEPTFDLYNSLEEVKEAIVKKGGVAVPVMDLELKKPTPNTKEE